MSSFGTCFEKEQKWSKMVFFEVPEAQRPWEWQFGLTFWSIFDHFLKVFEKFSKSDQKVEKVEIFSKERHLFLKITIFNIFWFRDFWTITTFSVFFLKMMKISENFQKFLSFEILPTTFSVISKKVMKFFKFIFAKM